MPQLRDDRRQLPAPRSDATGARLRGPARTLWAAWLASAMTAWRYLVRLAVAARRRASTVGSGWQEAAVALGAYGVYNLVKGFWGGSVEEGRRNAASLIDLENTLGIHWEPALQDYFVDHHLGMPFWNTFYVGSQVIVLPLTLFLVYRYRRDSYAFLRNMALISWSAGLVWYALQPVAPPRLLASGFTDTVSSPDVRGPRLAARARLLQPGRGHAEPARGHGTGGGLGALRADAVGVVARPGPRVPGPGGRVDRGDRQPLHPRHRRRARGGASGGGPRPPCSCASPAPGRPSAAAARAGPSGEDVRPGQGGGGTA